MKCVNQFLRHVGLVLVAVNLVTNILGLNQQLVIGGAAALEMPGAPKAARQQETNHQAQHEADRMVRFS